MLQAPDDRPSEQGLGSVAEALNRPDAVTSHLQPVLDVRHGRVYGYEGLLRVDQGGTPRSPLPLLQAAKAEGRLGEVDWLALRAALQAFAKQSQRGLKLFLNVFPSTIASSKDFLGRLTALSAEAGVRLADLVLEVVETEQIESFPAFGRFREQCRDLGIMVAIDDLGAGYSSLSYLAVFHPDLVKIEAALVTGLHQHRAQRVIVDGILRTCHALGIQTLAEGIEAAADFRVVTGMGVDLVQGYWVALPSARPQLHTGVLDLQQRLVAGLDWNLLHQRPLGEVV